MMLGTSSQALYTARHATRKTAARDTRRSVDFGGYIQIEERLLVRESYQREPDRRVAHRPFLQAPRELPDARKRDDGRIRRGNVQPECFFDYARVELAVFR